LTPIHTSSTAPTIFRKGNGQQLQREEDQHDAQHDGAGRAPQDALGALRGRQLAAGQRNDHGVVATQQDVDHDDLADGDPEVGGQQHVHGRGSGRQRAVWVWGISLGGVTTPAPVRGTTQTGGH
jgi:hypothetical protein